MSDFCFSFLEAQYRDIYLDCARMDKNLIEGDGVESILIAGRIAEKVTKTIFELEGFTDFEETQFKRLEKLKDLNILPNNIFDDFKELRRLRNDVYHDTLTSKTLSSSYALDKHKSNSYSKIVNHAKTPSGLRDYKTGFSISKDYSNRDKTKTKTPNHLKYKKSKKSKSKYDHKSRTNDFSNDEFNDMDFTKNNKSKYDYEYIAPTGRANDFDVSGELVAAREAHKLCFNICVWFYINYSGDKDFIRPQYKINKQTQESDFLQRLKSAVNENDNFLNLKKSNPNNEIVAIVEELFIPKPVEEFEEDIVYTADNEKIKIRKPNGPYSKCLGIHYDDNLFMWEARHAGKNLGYFSSSKEAFEAREIYIHSIPLPPKVNGHYSKYNGISFSRIQKLWTASVKGQIIAYYNSEKAAVKGRNKYLKKHNLVDLKVKGGFKTITNDELDKIKSKNANENSKSNSKHIKSIKSTSNSKSHFKKSIKSSKDTSPKPEQPKSKVKIINGSKVSNKPKNKTVKIQNGQRISKNKNGKNKTISNKSNHKNKNNSNNKNTNNKNNINRNNINKNNKNKNNNRINKNKSQNKSLGFKFNNKSKSNFKPNLSKKKSSKYEGVFYEEGLFMWSAEVNGKHLGLFESEQQAHEKRLEYLNRNS